MKRKILWLMAGIALQAQATAVAQTTLPPAATQYLPQVERTCQQYRIDCALVLAVIREESWFNPHAVSHKQAVGLMQLMPGTAKDLKVHNPYDPAANVDGGVRYLIKQIRQFGSVRKALWAYHAGPGNLRRGRIGPQTRTYAERVLRSYWRLKGEGY